ncbi:MAG: hypothetical protein AB1768_19355 [Pseudomonadota bacterium]
MLQRLREQTFAAQCIPLENDLLEVANYKAFLQERRGRIAAALNAYLGTAA